MGGPEHTHREKEQEMAEATLKQVAEFFRKDGESLTDFSKQWSALSESDKAQIKAGLGDGSLTY